MMKRKANRAFTLIELLAATALGAMLMAAVLVVVGSAVSQEMAMREAESDLLVPTRVADLMRWDLEQSRNISIGDSRIALEGYGAIRAEDLASVHRPATVVYRLHRIAERSFLVREQIRPDQITSRNAWLELICADVNRFELKPVEDQQPPGAGAAPRVPRAYRLLIEAEGAGRLAIEQTLVLR
jgi:prepilin-type N-terminal cleavage/methylation domain-containing protein